MIDFHVHAGKFELLRDDIKALLTKRPFERDADVRELFSDPALLEPYLRRHGVERAILLAECGPGTNFSIDSAMIAGYCRGSDFFIPFGSINPNFHDVAAELEKSLAAGVRGFKFYPADHSFDPYIPRMMDVYARCEAERLPIMFHTGSTAQRDAEQKFIRPDEFEGIIRRFPGLTVILAHAGRPSWFQRAKDVALEYENVYLDTALVDPATLVEQYGDLRALQHKILFGSDWPVVGSYTALMEKLRGAMIAADVAECILRTNGQRIIGAMRPAA